MDKFCSYIRVSVISVFRIDFLMRYALLFLFLLNSVIGFSQIDTLRSIKLKDFSVFEESTTSAFSNSNFSAGTSLFIADSSSLSQLQNNSLSEYLVRNTPVFIKESGQGMLSSISLRGTSSSHTAVSWNGLSINPLTMGQVDFSQLPLFFFDKVAVHAGGESALYGNGSIGGSILLEGISEYKKGWDGSVQQTSGSYDYSFSGIKIQGGNEKWQSKTALMYNECANDFDIEKTSFSGTSTESQQNASYQSYGWLQDLSFRLSSKNELLFSAWNTYYYREIQPSIQNNFDTASYDNILNRNSIFLVRFKHKSLLSLDSHIAYIDDYQENFDDIIASHQLAVATDITKTWHNITLKSGYSGQYIVPEVYAYTSSEPELRADLYVLSRWDINSAWKLSCNLRQAVVSGIYVPFTPSLGLETRLLDKKNQLLHFRFNSSRSFKVPTLNDRYWGGLDNRYLKSEDGFNNELGLDYSFKHNKYSLEFTSSVYFNRVENWIMWMPRGDIWKPQNIDLVEAKGIEARINQRYFIGKWEASFLLNYAFTQTIVVEGFSDMAPFEGRQMPLLPQHSATGLLQIDNKKFFITINANYVGERATSNIFDVMDSYLLFNSSVGYNLKLKETTLSLSVKANNLLGVEYETVPFKAMAKENYNFTLKYIF